MDTILQAQRKRTPPIQAHHLSASIVSARPPVSACILTQNRPSTASLSLDDGCCRIRPSTHENVLAMVERPCLSLRNDELREHPDDANQRAHTQQHHHDRSGDERRIVALRFESAGNVFKATGSWRNAARLARSHDPAD